MAGYHKREIKRGVYGELSKIVEEYEEFLDSVEQNNPVMALVELSDLIGSIEGYTVKKYNITLADLMELKNATHRAFIDGSRKEKR